MRYSLISVRSLRALYLSYLIDYLINYFCIRLLIYLPLSAYLSFSSRLSLSSTRAVVDTTLSALEAPNVMLSWNDISFANNYDRVQIDAMSNVTAVVMLGEQRF